MQTIKTDKWTAKVNADEINIDGFNFRPAEATKITNLLGFAGSMSELKVLPGDIGDPPYTIEFSDYGELTLISENGTRLSTFNFKDIDDLINLINDSVNVSIDTHKLRPHARGAVKTSFIPGNEPI